MGDTGHIKTNNGRQEMTTAEYREKAREAAVALNWALAAEMYEKALEVFPSHNKDNQLANNDKAALAKVAARYRAMAA